MSLLKDEQSTRKFIEKVLVPLERDEVFIMVLTARKKYCSNLSASLEVVRKDIIRNNDTDEIIRKIKKMSVVEELYVDNKGNIIPEEAFALYILPEPRSTIKAFRSFQKDVNDWIYEDLVGKVQKLENYRRIDAKLFSSIHKSKSRSIYYILDVDIKNVDLLMNIIKDMKEFNVDKYIKYVSKTHGGYHILTERNDETGKYIFIEMKKDRNVYLKDFLEVRKETMTPVVGCSQGGHIVKEFIYK